MVGWGGGGVGDVPEEEVAFAFFNLFFFFFFLVRKEKQTSVDFFVSALRKSQVLFLYDQMQFILLSKISSLYFSI